MESLRIIYQRLTKINEDFEEKVCFITFFLYLLQMKDLIRMILLQACLNHTNIDYIQTNHSGIKCPRHLEVVGISIIGH